MSASLTLWLLTALVAVVTSLASAILIEKLGGHLAHRRYVGRRLRGLRTETPRANARTPLLRREAAAGARLPFVTLRRDLANVLAQAGITLKPLQLAGLLLAGAALLSALVTVWAGGSTGTFLATFAGILLTAMAVTVVLVGLRRRNRLTRIEAQLPQAIDLLVPALRAGQPLSVALRLAADESEAPLADELDRLCHEISYGRLLDAALQAFAERTGLRDTAFLAAAIETGARTGGPLAAILEGASETLRSRAALRKKAQALASESQASALLMSVLPALFVGTILLLKPDYYASRIDDPVFLPAVLVMSGLYGVGIAMLVRIARVDV